MVLDIVGDIVLNENKKLKKNILDWTSNCHPTISIMSYHPEMEQIAKQWGRVVGLWVVTTWVFRRMSMGRIDRMFHSKRDSQQSVSSPNVSNDYLDWRRSSWWGTA
jgi:hypothetical protein